MKVFPGHGDLDGALTSPAVALGNFDGVHLGHRALLDAARAHAAEVGGESAVLTFWPHPAAVLAPSRAPALLTDRTTRLELLAQASIDACIVEPFDQDLSLLSPEQFVKSILVDAIGARWVVIGYDFTFGHQRAGNRETMAELGHRYGFEVDAIAPVMLDGQPVSSSRVREALRGGDLEAARRLLGRRFAVAGPIVRGAGRGRTIGVPTANVELSVTALPPIGIYAVWVVLDGDDTVHQGAASLGTNPTFEDSAEVGLEVHLLDYDGDLYGRRAQVTFVAKLRGEKRFDEVGQLVDQMQRDIADTRKILAQSER